MSDDIPDDPIPVFGIATLLVGYALGALTVEVAEVAL